MQPSVRPAPPANHTGPVVLGLGLVLPAVIALLVGYVWPTLRTAWQSIRSGDPLSDNAEFVGLDNYERVFAGDWFGPLAFALSLGVPLLLVVVLVAPLLALAADRAGRGGRLLVRLALAAPMVCFVPVVVALGWRFDRLTATPEGAAGDLRAAVWLGLFGLVCGLGATFYLAAFRRDRRGPGWPWAAAGTVAGLAAITAVAVGLQAFTYPFAMTFGGPARATVTPMLDAYEFGMRRLDFGPAAAQALLVLLGLMALGVAAALLVILTGLRVEVESGAEPRGETAVALPEAPARWDGVRVLAVVGTVLLLAGVLAVTVYGLWPWLTRLGFGPTEGTSVVSMLVRTWLPPIVSTVVGVGLAAVAAFGIGALRPLGRWSELLLLPFAPWLFVGVGPLFITKYDSAAFGPVERIDNVLGWVPPVWLVVPALFLFTLLFRGLAQQSSPYGTMVVRALPMVAVVGGATWLVQSQSLLWGVLVSPRPEDWPAPVWALRQVDARAIGLDDIGFGLVLPIPLIVVLAIGLALVQALYLDRLAIRVGRPAPG